MNSANPDSDNYWYDAAGERTVKESGDGDALAVNGKLTTARTGTTNFTAYISPYLVVNNGGQMSKHIYIGSQRIVSKLINSGTMSDPTAAATAGGLNLSSKYAAMAQKLKVRYDSLGVTYRGTDRSASFYKAAIATGRESQQYYYHSDHLGSSSLITDVDGNLAQHLEYVPFGEVFIDERNANWSTPYRFNGKEQDEETGLCYYGARYYDPKTSVWLSVDPLAEKYVGRSSYEFTGSNPVRFVDPDGRDWYKDKSYQYNKNLMEKNASTILTKDQSYAFKNKDFGGTNYRRDGSIMYQNEKDGYKRMLTQSKKTGKESMSAITDNGTLVLPDYKNISNKNQIRVNIKDYGYSMKNGNIVDASGHEYNTLATVHTHLDGSDPSKYDVTDFGDLGFAAFSTPYKPVYVLQMNGVNIISFIVSAPNKTQRSSGFDNFTIFSITSSYPSANFTNLLNGRFSLGDYKRNNNFHKILGGGK